MSDALPMFRLRFDSIFSPILTGLRNPLSLQLPSLQCSNQLMVRGFSLVELRCGVNFFSPMFRFALRNSQLFRLPPLRRISRLDHRSLSYSATRLSCFSRRMFFTRRYIYWGIWGIFLLFYLRTRACTVIFVSNWALYLLSVARS